VTRILVTGASGLLGVNVAYEAAKRYDVVGAVNENALSGAPFETLQVDLHQHEAAGHLLDDARPDWVIHCAALANLDVCEGQPELAHQLNAELPGRLASEAVKRNLRFLHVSTDAVYDGVKGNYTETDAPNPVNVYGRTKRMAELAVKAAHPHALIVRANLFGWSVSGDRSLAEYFLNKLADDQPAPGFTDRLFSPLLANDLANMFLALLEKNLKGIFNAVAADHLSKFDFGVALAKRFGFDPALVQPSLGADAKESAPRSPILTLQSTKLAKALGVRMPTVAAGVERLFELDRSGYRAQLRALATAPVAVKG
jgi:dTDP-4-dehydrorhamnose reductase